MTGTSAATDLDAAWRDGTAALRAGRPGEALAHLKRIIDAGRGNAMVWTAVAVAHRAAGDSAAQKAALQQVLAHEPRDLRALIMSGDLYAAEGDGRAASTYYAAAVRLAEVMRPADPAIQAEIARSGDMLRRYKDEFGDHVERSLAALDLDRPEARRARMARDLLLGRQELYLQQPRHFYFPELPQVAWAERADFPWLDRVEAETDAIRAELLQVLEEDAAGPDSAFSPYVQPEPDRPNFAPTSGLLGDPAWSAFYLWKAGAPQAENLARCPSVARALESAPLCDIGGRTPSVLFSLLRPGTHIKPHHGATNARFICHLPLIVPEGCAMRVGAETRAWSEGKACVFDDSVEHEAWNRNPDKLRVVMIFDIWRPELSEIERDLVRAMLRAADSYGGAAAWDS